MDELIDWARLKSYQDDKKKSFEELCYQIVFELYGTKGKLTPVDDSGGGDGVEFFIEFSDGTIWGWQCKFFGRFSEGGRKDQIKKSLQRAADLHGDKLKKWFLCSKLSTTPSEHAWFNDIGTQILNGRTVLRPELNIELIHWGDSVLLNFLRQYPDIHRYFFSDKILDLQWFRNKFELVRESRVIKSKYLEELHIEGTADEQIAKIVGGKDLATLMLENSKILNIEKFEYDYSTNIKKIRQEGIHESFEQSSKIITEFVLTDDRITLISRGNILLGTIRRVLLEKDQIALSHLLKEVNTYLDEYQKFYNEYSQLKDDENVLEIHWDTEKEESDDNKKRLIRESRECLFGPYFTMRVFDSYIHIFELLQSLNETELHIGGNASKGKTHLAVNTVRRKIEADEPALFLFGSYFKTNLPVREQIKQLLDIPSDWTVKDFLGALEICARVYKSKLVIAIDGLNESTYWKDIWAVGVEEFANEIGLHFPNLLLLTTYRTSYEDVLFPEGYLSYPDGKWQKKVEIDGFSAYNVDKAIEKYFAHYQITLQNNSDRLNHFTEPLYLKIFCEAKKGSIVSFHNEDMFDVFEAYLEKCNENVVRILDKQPRYNKSFTKDILNKISNKLWEEDKRDVELKAIIPDFLDHETLHAFESEDVLIFRDWYEQEVVAFTYDLLNGYLIAKSLLRDIKNSEEVQTLLKSKKFYDSLLDTRPKHPLFDDILRSFAILAIKNFGLNSLKSDSPTLTKYSVESLFDLNAEIVLKNELPAKKIIADAFKDISQTWSVISLFETTELILDHPLNFMFLSELLLAMNVDLRDIYWTQQCRQNYSEYEEGGLLGFIKNFEKVNRKRKNVSGRIHIAARKIMWFLTSTNRDLRDRATKALYFYGRNYPSEFMELTSYSLKVNDPYVWERTLGAMYGVILAEHSSNKQFREAHLKDMALMLYNSLFADNAPHATTHILARGYASLSVEAALKYFPDLLTDNEIDTIRAPYSKGGIREWGEYDYKNERGDHSDPIYMDFSNYTIGQIVDEGRSYNDPESKQQVRRQIYWRIFELGWHSLKFKEIDSRIQSQNHTSRTKKAKTERYGKKYSWIAFYELAGYRADLGLIKNEYKDFRIIGPDIDLSFPKSNKNNKIKFVDTDYLEDRSLPLMEWYKDGGGVDVSKYLSVMDLNGHGEKWVCLDAFICQEDKEIHRERFIFIRALLIKNKNLDDVLIRLNEQDFRNRWIPEKRENHESFAGEMYLFEEATYDNKIKLAFVEETRTYKVKRGHPDYYPTFNVKTFKKEYPEEVVVYKKIEKKFNILLPVMEYAFSSESSVNDIGYKTVISKEVVKKLELINEAQTFNLKDSQGNIASQEINYSLDYNNKHNLVYLRKDLLDKLLVSNDYSLVWGIWGERQVSFDEVDTMRDLHSESGLEKFPVFQSVEVYKP